MTAGGPLPDLFIPIKCHLPKQFCDKVAPNKIQPTTLACLMTAWADTSEPHLTFFFTWLEQRTELLMMIINLGR